MEWTKEQMEAISLTENKNILLAAAAGSGKTAVLVERIINKIKSKENPLSISELLVLTFTEAAASEMKRKILNAIKKELEKDPEDEHLREQALLVHSASISTVHAFCNKVLKGHIHMTDLPPEYKLAGENDAKLLLKEALDNTLEKYYSKVHLVPSFKQLAEAYGGVKDDLNLRKLILELYHFLKSLPYPKEWLFKAVDGYKPSGDSTDKYKKAQEEVYIKDILACYGEILKILETLPEDHKYPPFYMAEAELITETLNRYKKGEKEAVTLFKHPAKVRKQNTHPAEEQSADNLRGLAKDIFDEFKEFILSDTDESKELSENLLRRAKTLKNIILMLDRRYTELKRQKGFLDFSDLEQELLKLLSDRAHRPTQVAIGLKKRYSEILLDEYQDTNSIQEEIFRLISRDEKNIFMVGDLKQCIYKFRNAAPELFAAKRKSYKEEMEKGRLLSLSKNFRSRAQVVSTVNFLFSSLMREDLGDIDYEESEYLRLGADYVVSEKEDSFDTEYHIIPKNDQEDAKEAEASFIAKRIYELTHSDFKVYDTKSKEERQIEYKDIVVLLRHRTSASLIENALLERGIPIDSDTEGGYLSSPEIGIILSFLNIIDNPYQDIPLIAVLRSKMFGFTPDELAEIRLKNKKCWFYDAVKTSAEEGLKKAKDFVDSLETLREEADSIGLKRLILAIYERFNLPALMGLMTAPEKRRANLKLLLQRATEFERANGEGLFAFMNYLETVKEEGRDLACAKNGAESENAVRIMTIHKSKGLEFPVVFLGDTSHKFNTKDLSRSINFHSEAGICLTAVDTKLRIKYPSIRESMYKNILRKELLSEEMRLLYVALTRAKEKLIITSCLNINAKKKPAPIYGIDKTPQGAYLRRQSSFSIWLLSAFLPHPGAKELREALGYDEDIVSTRADFGLKVSIVDSLGEQKEVSEDKTENSALPLIKNIENCEEILSYTPPKGGKIPVKITVSEAKRRLSEKEELTPRLTDSKNIYLKDASQLSQAEKGTITHFVLQHIDERTIDGADTIKEVLESLEKEGVISKGQKEAVDTESLVAFYESPLGKRLKNSKNAYKEYSFYSKITAGEIFKDIEAEDKDTEILLQGTIDCFFEEKDGKIVLIDYKTDNVSKEQAEARAQEYRVQIELYNRALGHIFKKGADESYIYFLSSKTAVKIG